LNFKFYFFILLTCFFISCGVKNNPVAPAGTAIPSYIEKFKKTKTVINNDESNEKKDKKL